MARPVKLKTGVLSMKDKVYIAEHFLSHEPEWIAEKLKRSVTYITTYIAKLKKDATKKRLEEEELQTKSKENKKKFGEQTGVATVLTEEAAAFKYRGKKYDSPFKTR